MLGPSAGTLRCFEFVEGRRHSTDLVFIMVSGVSAEDRWCDAAEAAVREHGAYSTVHGMRVAWHRT